jgi:hypothetical protein
MAFVRQHIVFVIVVPTAIVAACLTDFLTGPWAQQYASGSIDSLGWFVSPLVRNANVLGGVTTFFVLWLFSFAYFAIVLSTVLFKRQTAPVQE